MLQVLTTLAASSYNPYDVCVAPLKAPEGIPNGKLLHSVILIRHGSRAPGSYFGDVNLTGEWHCDENESPSPRFNPAPVELPRNYRDHFDPRLVTFKPSCRQKDLIVEGMKQHIELGNFYRDLYIKKYKLTEDAYNPRNVLFRATEADRTLRSGISFLTGMFPSKSRNEVIQVMTDNDAAGLLHPSDSWCSELVGAQDTFFESQKFKDKWEELSKFKDLVTAHGIKWEPKKFKKFCSYVAMVDCTNHTLESWITPELAEACYKFMSFYNYGPHTLDNKYFGVGGSPMFREMMHHADAFLAMEQPQKFVLFSSHDTALVAMLPVIGITDENDIGPAVRAHLAFELWQVEGKVMARFVYNGEPVKVPFMDNKTEYLFTNLKLEMSRRGYLDHCMIPEWPMV